MCGIILFIAWTLIVIVIKQIIIDDNNEIIISYAIKSNR